MYRLQSLAVTAKNEIFKKKAKKKKKKAVVCFSQGCCDHFSGHLRILKIDRNGPKKVSSKARREEMDQERKNGVDFIHPEIHLCTHLPW